MAGEREIEEETRNQMMQNLFGDQSEEEEEEEVDSEHEPAPHHADYPSEGDVDIEGEGEVDVEGQGEVELESEADVDPEQVGRDISDQRLESEEDQEGFSQRVATSRRREVFASESESERSEKNLYVVDNDEEEEVDQERKIRIRSPSGDQDHAVVRDVFGDSEEDEPANYDAQNELEQDSHMSPMGEDGSEDRYLQPEDIVPDEDAQYESQDENLEHKPKERAMGPPLDLEIPIRRPPSQPDKMNMIKVSNIMGIEPKPFDPKTYVEEDVFITDESGTKKRIRLEDNIVRWRSIRNRDGTISHESNARFVRWSNGSLQLLIGNEVLDITVQEAKHDHTHLFLRHDKGILQSQGRLLHKMRFMPSSLSSKSHRLLTAIVDSRHKKVYKVKNCITDVDPEKEKEEKERAEGQSIRANELLQRKREKVSKKYTPSVDKGRQLSPGFLEEALDEDDEPEDHYSYHRAAARRRFEEDMEIESRAERRIINAKRASAPKASSRKASLSSNLPSRGRDLSDSEREESEYESDGDEDESPTRRRPDFNHEDEYEEEPEAEVEFEEANAASEDDEEEPRLRNKDVEGGSRKRKEIESDGESPPRKTVNHRRMAVVFDSDEE